jgi:hypothetical protein
VRASTTADHTGADESVLAADARVCYPAGTGTHSSGTTRQSASADRAPEASGPIPKVQNEVVNMSELSIGEMIRQVPEGQARAFPRSIADPGEERFFQASQNWKYRPERLKWLNGLSLMDAPWFGTRRKARIPVSALPTPDVQFNGPASQVVDFYSTGCHAFFISDKLFRLIETIDPGSLEHTEFEVHAKDGALPFHAVMPSRVLEAIDTRRSTVRIEDENLAGWYSRRVIFPEGIAFNNDALKGIHSFSDLDAPGWYWSIDLIQEAKAQGVLGIHLNSIAASDVRLIHIL